MELEKCLWGKCLENKGSIVVVGAASSIGDALVPKLLAEYPHIILTETSDNYECLVHKYEVYKQSDKVSFYELDVTCKAQIEEFDAFIESNGWVVSSLIYLAGINILISALELTEEIWDQVMDINLKGFFLLAQLIARNMILNGGGSIIGIASQHGVVANIDRAAYCASKAGLIHLTKELALEWAKYGVRVNVVSPTMILSDKNKGILQGAKGQKEYLSKIPLRQYATPEDVSNAVLFLDSEKAGMITGQNLVVDGGWTIY